MRCIQQHHLKPCKRTFSIALPQKVAIFYLTIMTKLGFLSTSLSEPGNIDGICFEDHGVWTTTNNPSQSMQILCTAHLDVAEITENLLFRRAVSFKKQGPFLWFLVPFVTTTFKNELYTYSKEWQLQPYYQQ